MCESGGGLTASWRRETANASDLFSRDGVVLGLEDAGIDLVIQVMSRNGSLKKRKTLHVSFCCTLADERDPAPRSGLDAIQLRTQRCAGHSSAAACRVPLVSPGAGRTAAPRAGARGLGARSVSAARHRSRLTLALPST